MPLSVTILTGSSHLSPAWAATRAATYRSSWHRRAPDAQEAFMAVAAPPPTSRHPSADRTFQVLLVLLVLGFLSWLWIKPYGDENQRWFSDLVQTTIPVLGGCAALF